MNRIFMHGMCRNRGGHPGKYGYRRYSYEVVQQSTCMRAVPHAQIPSLRSGSSGSRQENLSSEYRPARYPHAGRTVRRDPQFPHAGSGLRGLARHPGTDRSDRAILPQYRRWTGRVRHPHYDRRQRSAADRGKLPARRRRRGHCPRAVLPELSHVHHDRRRRHPSAAHEAGGGLFLR